MQGPVDRRGFIARAALLPLGVGLGIGGASRTAAAQEPIKRAGGPRLKTSLNAYSFNKSLNDQLKARAKGVSLFDLLDFCAELDFDALDPTGYFFPGYPKVPGDRYMRHRLEYARRWTKVSASDGRADPPHPADAGHALGRRSTRGQSRY